MTLKSKSITPNTRLKRNCIIQLLCYVTKNIFNCRESKFIMPNFRHDGSIGCFGRYSLNKNKKFKNFVHFLFLEFSAHNFWTAQPNLIIFKPIDRSFDNAAFGIYKVLKNLKWNTSKNETYWFAQRSNRVNPTRILQ